eukprot:2453619-Prymnesium_polylepis.1
MNLTCWLVDATPISGHGVEPTASWDVVSRLCICGLSPSGGASSRRREAKRRGMKHVMRRHLRRCDGMFHDRGELMTRSRGVQTLKPVATALHVP